MVRTSAGLGLVSRTLTESDLESGEYPGQTWYVDGGTGSDVSGRDGKSWGQAFATIQKAIDSATHGDQVLIAPKQSSTGGLSGTGVYDESITIAITKTQLRLVGMGQRLAVSVAPSAANAIVLTCHADDVTVENIDFASNGTGKAARVSGRRFHSIKCKYEGDQTAGGFGVIHGPVKNSLIHTVGQNGSDALYEGDEFAWTDKGFEFLGSDYGGCTEVRLRGCTFHNIVTAEVTEAHNFTDAGQAAGGGDAQHHYDAIEISDCVFADSEGGTQPTKYLDLNADNANKGILKGCVFPQAINGGKALVSTGLKFVGNYMTGGISAAQPS